VGGGEWGDADSGETFPVTNPATGEELAQVPRMGEGETRRALEAAERALSGWRVRTAADRARILRRWADLMVEHVGDLVLLLTLEQGKPLVESEAEIRYAASFLEWFGEEAWLPAGVLSIVTGAAEEVTGAGRNLRLGTGRSLSLLDERVRLACPSWLRRVRLQSDRLPSGRAASA
jgi:acyl-CoA reductase-like NAD-dependent aldehyde dehydrogenase